MVGSGKRFTADRTECTKMNTPMGRLAGRQPMAEQLAFQVELFTRLSDQQRAF